MGADRVAEEQVTCTGHQQGRREPVEVAVDRRDSRIGNIQIARIQTNRRINEPDSRRNVSINTLIRREGVSGTGQVSSRSADEQGCRGVHTAFYEPAGELVR
jgi:hypothetical protein